MTNLKQYREQMSYSHQKMANKLKISKAYYWQLENNLRRLSYEMATKISDIFKTTPDHLFYQEVISNIKNKKTTN